MVWAGLGLLREWLVGVSSVLELVFKKLESMIYSHSCFSMYSQYQCDANAFPLSM